MDVIIAFIVLAGVVIIAGIIKDKFFGPYDVDAEKDRKRFLKKIKSAIKSGEMTATPNGATVVYNRCKNEFIQDKIAKLPFDINELKQETKKLEADALEEVIDETLESEPFRTIIERLDSVAEKKAEQETKKPEADVIAPTDV